MQNLATISDLKLRASYGKAGTYAVPVYSTQSNLVRMPFAFDEKIAVGYAYDTRLGNDELGWEISTTINAGVDFGLFKNRVTGTLDVFKTNTEDLLLDRLLPSSSGATRIIQNIGKTETRGIELALSAVAIDKGDFTWRIGASWFRTKEKITSLPSGSNDIANGWFIGEPTFSWYDYEKVGIWQTDEADEATSFGQTPGQIKVKDQNDDGIIDSNNDRVILGSPRPGWIGNITSDFRYKNFDLSVQVFARWGQTIRYTFANLYDPQANENSIRHDYWTPENPTNEYPRPNASVSSSAMPYVTTLQYRDGSFLKIRGITLGYNLPKSLLDKTPFTGARVYVNGKNLFTYSKIDNYDPERGGAQASPLSKLIVGGISLDF
jgi:TonB-dependent starch-binding outer membrane protein SusC